MPEHQRTLKYLQKPFRTTQNSQERLKTLWNTSTMSKNASEPSWTVQNRSNPIKRPQNMPQKVWEPSQPHWTHNNVSQENSSVWTNVLDASGTFPHQQKCKVLEGSEISKCFERFGSIPRRSVAFLNVLRSSYVVCVTVQVFWGSRMLSQFLGFLSCSPTSKKVILGCLQKFLDVQSGYEAFRRL